MAKLFFYIFIFILAVITSLRDWSIGVDTSNYIEIFNLIISGRENLRFEPGFIYVSYFIGQITTSPIFFLFTMSFFVYFLYFEVFNVIQKSLYSKRLYFINGLIFFSLLMFSSWFFNASVNGIRQGIALILMYLSIILFWSDEKSIKIRVGLFLILFLIGVSFHYSILLVLPFMILLFFRFGIIFIVWIISAIAYPMGIGESTVKALSHFFSLGVYEFIKYYSISDSGVVGKYSGFIISFYFYTIFWPLFYLLFVRLVRKGSIDYFLNNFIFKIYLVLCLPYFFFGFGPYSNRFAVISWLFVPVFQLMMIKSIRLPNYNNSLLLFSFIFVCAFLYFVIVRLGFL